ncbi:MAG: flagellar hook-basal body complex protein [Gemmobacter sp.]|uniref:flagellar hook protein FlgE n=1 Tax=Gemmobacter sp. TaxID=1898957 RepID=UPI001A603833|nr:flagellar hook-basal body complex protein [Gemmobacter sp.]MBL8562721.1 flagellar hook-basal body complex protein [Gemmobacter sp.]
MTISSALNAGVAGLNANASRLATISDNIANSGTYGYKRATTEFEALILTSASPSGTYVAGGVRSAAARQIDERGALIGTANALDLAMSGRGMLPVTRISAVDSPLNGNDLMMTSTASFNLNEDGILRSPSGLVLLGWPANQDGTIPVQPRDTISGLEPIFVDANAQVGEATTQVNLNVNLPATATRAGATISSIPLSVEYFDNLGTSSTLEFTFTPTVPATGQSNTWTVQITDSAQNNAVVGEFSVEFDASRGSGGAVLNVTPLSAGTYDAATGMLDITTGSGTMQVDIGIIGEKNRLSQLSDVFTSTGVTKNGAPSGTLTELTVDERGMLVAAYDTGFTRVLYQVPVVDVPNVNGLTALSDQTYEISPESGPFFLWDAGDGPTGEIVGYARETSTTDVAAELTSLIQTQRAYSSNAKVIQTVDEMLQETTNIKR